MSKTSTFQTPFRRRNEGRTNYVKRLAFLKSGSVRAVVRKSTNHMQVQFVQTVKGVDQVLASAHTKELENYSYKGHGGNVPAAYLVGYLAGKRFLSTKGTSAIADIGVQRPNLGTRVFATVKGVADAGVEIKADAEAFPKKGRVEGKHIETFAQHEASKKHTVQFSTYAKRSVDASTFSKMVEQAKQQINDKSVNA